MSTLGRLDVRGDLTALVVGTGLTAVWVFGATQYGSGFSLVALVSLSFFVAATVCFLVAPHVAIAATIPLFAFTPALKVVAGYWIGPVKDAVTLSAALAAALYVMQRDGRAKLERTDGIVLGSVGMLAVLYVLNTGGISSDAWHGSQWLHGVRLTMEPLLLLLAGLLLARSRKSLQWAATSVVATGCVVAALGIIQQVVGLGRLADFGYSYDQQLKTIGPYLRSFGTLDDSFAYAAFLFLALVTVIFWMRKGALAWSCGLLIGVGILVSFVQTAAVVAGALLALWLVRGGRTAVGVMLFAATLAAGFALAIAASSATESRTVRAGPSTYLTLNGRTSVWATIFADETKIPFGLGVGSVGRASLRAQIGVTDVSGSAGHSKEGQTAVDSGYFAAVADVGIAGLAALVLLLGRIVALAARAARPPGRTAGWLCLGYLTVLMLDATTRDSFTGFPTAYVGFLLVGLALAALQDEGRELPEVVGPAR